MAATHLTTYAAGFPRGFGGAADMVGAWVSGAPPVNPQAGWLWWDTADGQMYVWTGCQWVAASCCDMVGSQVGGAPPVNPRPGTLWWATADGQLYVYDGREWVAASCCPSIFKGVVADPSQLPAAGNSPGDMILVASTGHLAVWDGTRWVDTARGATALVALGDAPPLSPAPGSLWWCTTDGQLYVHDGAEWVAASCCPAGARITIADAPPANPLPGDLWWDDSDDPDGGDLYIRYDDGDTQQWVPASSGGAGPPGPQGPQGPQGQPGPQGEAGIGINLKGEVPTGPPTATDPANGDAWIALDTGHLWVWDGTSWIDAGNIVGPAGPAGPAGPQGPGSVESVGLAAPQGLAVTGSPVTESGTLTLAWSGTIPNAQVPPPTGSALGGVLAATAPSGQVMTGIDATGAPQFAARGGPPTIQTFKVADSNPTTAVSGTYTPSPGMTWIRVRMVGGGGGGGGNPDGGSPNSDGGAGGATTFGDWSAGGGGGGAQWRSANNPGNGGAGGAAFTAGTGTLVVMAGGGDGGYGVTIAGSPCWLNSGGVSYFGAVNGGYGGTLVNRAPGSGAPGCDGYSGSQGSQGGGGGAGLYLEFIMTAAQVGAGLAWTVGNAGQYGRQSGPYNNGAPGIIIVEEHYT